VHHLLGGRGRGGGWGRGRGRGGGGGGGRGGGRGRGRARARVRLPPAARLHGRTRDEDALEQLVVVGLVSK
jgi:hypothetical protein